MGLTQEEDNCIAAGWVKLVVMDSLQCALHLLYMCSE